MRSLQTLVVRLFNNTIMEKDTLNLIGKLCTELQLTPDIEFTCYQAHAEYCKRYFEKRFKQTTFEYNGAINQTNELMQSSQELDEVEKTTLLHTLALISICAKYVNGFRSEKLFVKLTQYLENNGTPCSSREFRNTEYIVFKYLEFNIKPSELYAEAIELARKISKKHCDLVQYNSLHDSCVNLLRKIYHYRKDFDEILHYVEENTYNYFGNEEFKLAAATLYASTILIKSQGGNIVLNEIVKLTYLNESLVRKLGQSVHDFYLDCIRY
ncbi:uncharacterized protein LOC116340448 isoform X2 [Contarinia nasturtii]|uniref:uncharacterized protein LOC116340448 isoform X2 n=1 Tax=Contarinia nasturtii TaxID=265458 RepID=UPI0012D39797|nr:uncharacterized protein LOC116340448 isoform X2 [Contarinia nasturtii]